MNSTAYTGHICFYCLRGRLPTPEEAKKGLRRTDLLGGKTGFLVLDWRTSDARYLDVMSIESLLLSKVRRSLCERNKCDCNLECNANGWLSSSHRRLVDRYELGLRITLHCILGPTPFRQSPSSLTPSACRATQVIYSADVSRT
jgi:hypothetical protein